MAGVVRSKAQSPASQPANPESVGRQTGLPGPRWPGQPGLENTTAQSLGVSCNAEGFFHATNISFGFRNLLGRQQAGDPVHNYVKMDDCNIWLALRVLWSTLELSLEKGRWHIMSLGAFPRKLADSILSWADSPLIDKVRESQKAG